MLPHVFRFAACQLSGVLTDYGLKNEDYFLLQYVFVLHLLPQLGVSVSA